MLDPWRGWTRAVFIYSLGGDGSRGTDVRTLQPALRATRVDLASSTKQSGGGKTPSGNWLISTIQAALYRYADAGQRRCLFHVKNFYLSTQASPSASALRMYC